MSEIQTLPERKTPKGHDAYCHVCWEPIYILWADREPPDNSRCFFGPYTAQTCPEAVAAAQRAALNAAVKKAGGWAAYMQSLRSAALEQKEGRDA
jgi:hypothetical protein